MNGRMLRLVELMRDDCKDHNPPLSARFIEENDVTGPEFDTLCDIIASGLDSVSVDPILDAAAVAA